MIHANLDLALRLESVVARQCRGLVTIHNSLVPGSAAAYMPCGSGSAVYFDEGSPLTQVKAAGMAPPTMEAEIDAVEEFFQSRSAPVIFVITPFADPALCTLLSRRGYELGACENTLVKPLTPGEFQPDSDVETAANEREWSATLAESVFDIVTPAGLELGQVFFLIPTAHNFLVRAGLDPADPAAAAAQLDIVDNVATLQCDGVIRRYRQAGLHKKLIRHRLALAAQLGCDIATADVLPGSISQCNFEKCGFRVAWTKTTLVKSDW